MKRSLLLILLLFATLTHRTNAGEWVHFPAYRRTVLSNGVTLLVMEKHGAPLITVTLALKSGSLQDPAGKEGLADITNDLLRKGAANRSAEQISDDLDFIGATLETSTTYELTRVHTEFLKKDLTAGIDLFTDLILKPTYPAVEVDKLLKQRVDGIKAAKDEPLEVIGHYYQQFLFGSHPYGRPPGGDEQSTDRIRRDDVVRFHELAYVSSNMVIAACGDFSAVDMEKILSSRFGSLSPKYITALTLPDPDPVAATRLELIDKPDSTQTFFRFGNTGISVTDPDRVVVDIVNTLFGGRFTSKLNTALRIDSGLTYGAASSFERRARPGAFFINSYTQNDSTEKALNMALNVLKDLHEKGFTDAEVASAKAYIKGQFGPRVETADQLADLMIRFEIYGLDKKEVDDYAARIDAVTSADVLRVIKKDYPTTNLAFTIIGKASQIEPVIKKYSAQIETRSISDPGFGKK